MTFKVGDKVRCKSGFLNHNYGKFTFGGTSYRNGLLFVITKIFPSADFPGHYFFHSDKFDGFIYSFTVEHDFELLTEEEQTRINELNPN